MQVYFKCITNLADARCVTAWGARYLSFMLGRGHDLKVDEALVHTITPWLAGTQVVLDFQDDYEGYREAAPAFDESVYWFSLYLDFARISVDEARSLVIGLPRLPHIVELGGFGNVCIQEALSGLPDGISRLELHLPPPAYPPADEPLIWLDTSTVERLREEPRFELLLNTDHLKLTDSPWAGVGLELGLQGFAGVSFNRIVRPNSPFELDYDVCEHYLRALGYEC